MMPIYACLCSAGLPGPRSALAALAGDFSPRFECHRDDLVSIDVSGLGRLFGEPRAIGEALAREASARGIRAHVAVSASRMAALVLAQARPGLTVVEPGGEAAALAPLRIEVLERVGPHLTPEAESLRSRPRDSEARPARGGGAPREVKNDGVPPIAVFKQWGLRTLGDLAALPAAALAARLGRPALAWQAMARGDDLVPLVPSLPEERFESSIELEWPIEGHEPLSFVLTRLLEPLSTRLERRDRGAAVLHVVLRLVTREVHARRLELPSPIRDVRTLRTLALVDLDSHPPAAAIDGVTIVIDPTPGRVLQHTLFTRAQPSPERISTLLARLGALMGQDRIGRPAAVETDRPGAFAMQPFPAERESLRSSARHGEVSAASGGGAPREVRNDGRAASNDPTVVSALRRCRVPVPARVSVSDGTPVRVTTDRRAFAAGAVVACAGPWRTSGDWWTAAPSPWDRDEWDVTLGDGGVYRIFRDRRTDGWFIDAIVD